MSKRNVEIKCKVDEPLLIFQKKVINLCNCNDFEELNQVDIFFDAPKSRLKLRIENKSIAKLISYSRSDVTGPKVSTFTLTPIDISEAENLISTLTHSIGVLGMVEKTRLLYIYGQTRIHIDVVKNLELYMELEVCLTEDQTVEEGQLVAESIMNKLNLNEENLISGSYHDLLLKL